MKAKVLQMFRQRGQSLATQGSQSLEPRVRVVVGTDIRWMTLEASRVMLNDMARNRKLWQGGLEKSHCKHGHLLAGANVKKYRYQGYLHRTCIACVNERNQAYKLGRRKAKA